jgi:hypothetical protein
MFILVSFIISFFLLIFLANRELWFGLFFDSSIFALTNLTFPEYKLLRIRRNN